MFIRDRICNQARPLRARYAVAFVFLVSILLISLEAGPSLAEIEIGAIAGLNRASISGDSPDKISYGRLTGGVGGLVADVRLADDVHLSFQPMYVSRGTKLQEEIEGEQEPVEFGSLDLSYASLPVLVRFTTGKGRTYVASGLDFGALLEAKLESDGTTEDVKDLLTSSDIAFTFAFGGFIPAGRTRITLEGRYSQSLVNLHDGSSTEDRFPARFRSTGLQLLAGVLIPLGGGK